MGSSDRHVSQLTESSALQRQIPRRSLRCSRVVKRGDGALSDTHLMDLVGTIGKSCPPRLLQHVRKGRVGGIPERPVNLNRPVDDAPQTVRHKMFRHRHDRSEIHLLFNLICGM